DLSDIDTARPAGEPGRGSLMGFGSALAFTGTAPTAGGGAGADLQVPPGASPDASRASGQQRLLAYLAEHGTEATVKGAARALGVAPRTIRRYRDALAGAGHDMGPLYPENG